MLKYLIAIPKNGKIRYVKEIRENDFEIVLTKDKSQSLGEESLELANSLNFQYTTFKVITTPLKEL